MNIHRAAAEGFERGAAEYEKGRPGYPQAVVDRLVEVSGLGEGATVVDIGAGTGKFTRLLIPTGARVVAVEPVGGMRRTLAEVVPGIEILDGTGESLPIDDGRADVVTAAQTAHWFDGAAAFAEIARVLRPGGTLALVWNRRDDDWPWTKPIDDLMARVAGDAPRFRQQTNTTWDAALAANDDFDEVRLETFPNPVTHDLESMLARVSSVSYVSALPDDERAALLAELEAILRDGPMAGGVETFVEPYVTELYWCHRR